MRETASLPPTVNPVERLASLMGEDLGAVDAVIHARMLSEAALIPQVGQHLVDSGGKRLRPLITLASARQFGYRGDAHVKLAAAVEFIHTATLLHDDVVDESALRRGRPAANLLWGNKPSILVGDFLFSRAFQLMVEVGSPHGAGRARQCLGGHRRGRSAAASFVAEPRHRRERISEGDHGQDRGAVSRPPRKRARWRRAPIPRNGRPCANMAAISASPSSWWTMRSIIRGARR